MINIAAFTHAGPYPAFVSVNKTDERGTDGLSLVEITVRSPSADGQSTGPEASIKMSPLHLRPFINELQQTTNLLWKAY